MTLGTMDKIVFADSWEPYFAGLGLKTFDDFYEYADANTVGKNHRRNVQRLAFDTDGNRCTFFMKRFQSPHFKDMVAACRTCGRPTTQAGVEWHNARYLLDNGIVTYEPVCMGERTRWGLERNSFFVTRELEGECLRDFVINNWYGLDRSRQEQILAAVAQFVRTLHQLGIVFPDLYIWHLFLRTERLWDDCQLSIIDLHRMTAGMRSQRRQARDLSRLCWSMVPKYFDDDHKEFLLETCLLDFNVSQRNALRGVIARYEATLNKRHTADRYYGKKASQLQSA